MDIILYLLQTIQELFTMNYWLINFICRYIPLKQWAHDDSHSPKYQKFKTDQLPKIISYKQDWEWTDLIKYYKKRYGEELLYGRYSRTVKNAHLEILHQQLE